MTDAPVVYSNTETVLVNLLTGQFIQDRTVYQLEDIQEAAKIWGLDLRHIGRASRQVVKTTVYGPWEISALEEGELGNE